MKVNEFFAGSAKVLFIDFRVSSVNTSREVRKIQIYFTFLIFLKNLTQVIIFAQVEACLDEVGGNSPKCINKSVKSLLEYLL